MRQIQRDLLLKLISNNHCEYIQEQVVHVMFLLYGEDMDNNIIENNDRKDNNEKE